MSPTMKSPIRVMRIIARMNVGGPAVQVSGLMRGFNAADFDHRLYKFHESVHSQSFQKGQGSWS